MTDVDYLAILRQVPDFAAHLAAQMMPGGSQAGSGSRTTTQPWTHQDVVIVALEEAIVELADAVDFWWKAQSDYLVLPEPDLSAAGCRRTEFGVRYQRVVSDNPLQAARDAGTLANTLIRWWEEIEGHPYWEWWCETLDQKLIPAMRRLDARQVQQRLRRCERCGSIAVAADLNKVQGRCFECKHVQGMPKEIWRTIKHVAAILDRHPSKIRAWIRQGELEARPGDEGREVELNAARDVRDMMEARKKLGIAS